MKVTNTFPFAYCDNCKEIQEVDHQSMGDNADELVCKVCAWIVTTMFKSKTKQLKINKKLKADSLLKGGKMERPIYCQCGLTLEKIKGTQKLKCVSEREGQMSFKGVLHDNYMLKGGKWILEK